eukprot:scaffold15238_cov214-Alexandrium_tamarense.AAC.5
MTTRYYCTKLVEDATKTTNFLCIYLLTQMRKKMGRSKVYSTRDYFASLACISRNDDIRISRKRTVDRYNWSGISR